MLGFLSYLPTIAFVPHSAFLLAAFYLLFKHRSQVVEFVVRFYRTRQLTLPANLIIIGVIVLLALINRIIHPFHITAPRDFFPFIILLFLTYFIAVKLTRSDIKIIVILIFIESLVVMAEYAAGVSTFFTSLANYTEFDSGTLLYFKRPLGLSENSSHIAGKLILGFILVDFINWKNLKGHLLQLTMIVALFLTFNRSAFVALIAYIALRYLPSFLSMNWKVYKVLFFSTMGIVLLTLAVFWLSMNIEEVYTQFTRNQGKIELAGRELIWAEFAGFIKENWFFGNGSHKLVIPYHGKLAHAHNSFLQSWATHGIIITLLYIYLVVRNLNKRNRLFVFTICLYSMAQYGVFWGISLMDIIFIMLLVSPAFAAQEKGSQPNLKQERQIQIQPSK